MHYQIGWETAPGLGGLRCGDFRAVPTAQPDTERGVAIGCGDPAEAQRLADALDEHFRLKRFSNDAAAFETVKLFVLEWTAKRPG